MRSTTRRDAAGPDRRTAPAPSRHHRRRSAVVLAGLAAATLALSGCVAAQDAPSGSRATGTISKDQLRCGAEAGKKATGTPIQVRAITTASGGVDFSSSTTAAAAWFECLNASGGIDGHPVAYEVGDDAFNPTKSGQLAARYGADPDVVALVADSTYAGCEVANAQYAKDGLYSITGVGIEQKCFESSNIAPVNAGPRISGISALAELKKQGKAKSVFIAGINTQSNLWVEEGLDGYARANGIQVAGTGTTDPTESNFLPLLNQVKASGATSVTMDYPGPIAAAILAAAEKQGMDEGIAWSCPSACYDVQFGSQVGPSWDGLIVDSELAMTDEPGEDNELWKSVMDAHASKDAPRDTFSQAGFLAAKIFSDTLVDAKLDTYDRASVATAMVGIKNYSSDLLCAPWYYGEAPTHNANHATRTTVLKDGAYDALSTCAPSQDPGLASVLERERSQGLVG